MWLLSRGLENLHKAARQVRACVFVFLSVFVFYLSCKEEEEEAPPLLAAACRRLAATADDVLTESCPATSLNQSSAPAFSLANRSGCGSVARAAEVKFS